MLPLDIVQENNEQLRCLSRS